MAVEGRGAKRRVLMMSVEERKKGKKEKVHREKPSLDEPKPSQGSSGLVVPPTFSWCLDYKQYLQACATLS